ncbi:MAG: NYN domain-containing protein [Trueperaceae bacterium]|nr:NYN domain-containing protein [Trueperaceae bacterium]
MRVRFLIDGFNVYHSLKDAAAHQDAERGSRGFRGTRWFNVRRLCLEFLRNECPPESTFEKILYFTAYATHIRRGSAARLQKQQLYLDALKDTGVEVHLGQFRRAGRLGLERFEEKETDVAICAHLMAGFALDLCDMTVIVSGDTDLAPALRVARETFPEKRLGILFPYGRQQKELQELVDTSQKVSRRACFALQLRDPYRCSDGRLILKPTEW